MSVAEEDVQTEMRCFGKDVVRRCADGGGAILEGLELQRQTWSRAGVKVDGVVIRADSIRGERVCFTMELMPELLRKDGVTGLEDASR